MTSIYDPSHGRRSYPGGHPPAQPPAGFANPSAFSTLSSVAMDELYTLERQEAFRRAEYEARHAEALRRAEYESRRTEGRLSKSAATSPAATSYHAASDERGYFGISSERDWHPTAGRSAVEEEDAFRDREREREQKTRRRMSGPAWQMTPVSGDPALGPSHSTGHLVDAHGQLPRAHGPWGHPYGHQAPHLIGHPQQPQPYRHIGTHDDSPSPISSDSESVPHQMSNSPPAPYPMHPPHLPVDHQAYPGMRSSEFNFTPSTSPFLGPFRTLNLHSSNPSRVPSPILLPPPSIVGGDVPIPMDDSYPRSRGNSTCGSPPGPGYMNRAMAMNKFKGPEAVHHVVPHIHPHAYHSSHLQDQGLPPPVPTPQLSSGPSSSGSSPRSISHPLPSSGPTSGESSSASNSNSRPGSPSRGHYHRDTGGHHHLAHSVRQAFGMTPIHPLPPLRNTSWASQSQTNTQTHSNASTPGHYVGTSTSMPSSRSGSPPITLPPLKNASALSSPTHRPVGSANADDDVSEGETTHEKEKVELPGFSQFAAAARAPSGMDARMPVDFP